MNNFEIENLLTSVKYTKSLFAGVYCVDNLPSHVQLYPSVYVINTDESNGSGEHWVCVYFDVNCNAEFFCSFGNAPDYYDKRILKFIKNNSFLWKSNTKRLQNDLSTVCGQYCIFYCFCKAHYFTMNKICSLFSADYVSNDYIVNAFVCTNLNISLPVVDVEFFKDNL